MSSQLPDKPSELIRLALADLEKCEVDNSYIVNMNYWHRPTEVACHVCLAGAVMAKSLGTCRREAQAPSSSRFDSALMNRLYALDHFRKGAIGFALLEMYGADYTAPGSLPRSFRVAEYHQNPTQFKSDMRSMADMLESHGL